MKRSYDMTSASSSSAVLMEDEQPEIRVEKVLEIRRQLGEGRYSIGDRLDVTIERIIEDLG
jgi:anti-sigma28 factor (negative regulator of flagellin synthesis)